MKDEKQSKTETERREKLEERSSEKREAQRREKLREERSSEKREAQRREKLREERSSEKRESQRRERVDARKGRKVANYCVFSMICGSGGSKSKFTKAAGAEPVDQEKKLHAVVV